MKKRGISPILATVILVGCIVIIASLAYRFSFQTVTSTQEETIKLIDSAMPVQFSTKYQDPDCEPGMDCTTTDNACYRIFIENEENKEVGFIVRSLGNMSVVVSNDENQKLDPFETGIFIICYDSFVVGNVTSAEIIPVTY